MQATINGIRINYQVDGPETATPVVLHHPIATNLTIWDELTAALTPRYRVVRFDARGHGQSEAPAGPYKFETLAADVVGLMDHLKIDRAHYVGLSIGGMIGQHLGIAHPKRFHTLQLVATTSRVPPEAKQMWDERIAAAREKGMASQAPATLQRWLTEPNRKKPELVARFTKMIETTPVEGFAGWAQAIPTLNVTERIKSITLPTQVISGAEDPGTPVAAGETIHRQIAGSSFVVIPGVAHMLCAEDPATFHKHVLAFLDKHAARA